MLVIKPIQTGWKHFRIHIWICSKFSQIESCLLKPTNPLKHKSLCQSSMFTRRPTTGLILQPVTSGNPGGHKSQTPILLVLQLRVLHKKLQPQRHSARNKLQTTTAKRFRSKTQRMMNKANQITHTHLLPPRYQLVPCSFRTAVQWTYREVPK